MKRVQSLLTLTLSFLLVIPSASAVENGTNATGFEFVVPIKTRYDIPTWISCSGVLIAPSIVATAGHCVIDSKGFVTNLVYVGEPGSSMDSVKNEDIVTSIVLSNGYKSVGAQVPADDIVLLVLGNPKTFKGPIRLASEAEVQALKSTNGYLRVYGYGDISDSGDKATYPLSTAGYFSPTAIFGQPDSAAIERLNQNICKGDSGGPVLSVSATEVIVVGIITGGVSSGLNSGKSCSRNNMALFTVVSRYANLAFSAAVYQMKTMQTQIDKIKTESATDLQSARSAATTELELTKEFAASAVKATEDANDEKLLELFTQIEDLKDEIMQLQAKLPKTITCLKGKATKKVTAVSPRCPAGYKKK